MNLILIDQIYVRNYWIERLKDFVVERRELKLISEEQKFDVDHYLADKFENAEVFRGELFISNLVL